MRAVCLIAALTLLALVWTEPVSSLATERFSAHMARHMLLVTLVPILVVLGISGTRSDPATHAPHLFSPLAASLVDLVVVWAWHMPALHHAASLRWDAAVAQQASFLVAGLWFWVAVFGGGPRRRAEVAGESVVALMLTFAHMTMLGALLATAPRPLYVHAPVSSDPLSLIDQQIGGVVMLAMGTAAYIGIGLWLSHQLLRAGRPREVLS